MQFPSRVCKLIYSSWVKRLGHLSVDHQAFLEVSCTEIQSYSVGSTFCDRAKEKGNFVAPLYSLFAGIYGLRLLLSQRKKTWFLVSRTHGYVCG